MLKLNAFPDDLLLGHAGQRAFHRRPASALSQHRRCHEVHDVAAAEDFFAQCLDRVAARRIIVAVDPGNDLLLAKFFVHR